MSDPSSAVSRLSGALADRYRIERELGQGGMATVYLAEDLKHKRKVALKVLKPELAAVLGAERFVQEITTTAALQHPHILPLFDSGTADGFLYYVMPFIDGETLRSRLDRETQLGIDEAVKITVAVADALDYAHRQGVIHRDIKPENILLHDGRPMVADFGIALALSAAAGGRMTETGLSLGTPHYMSPEQATAEKEISGRSDIYSLGCVLYEMLTGNPPHVGASAQQIIMKIVTEEAAPVTRLRKAVPPNVAAAVAESIEKLPADRFANAKAFAEALANAGYTNAAFSATGAASAGGASRVLTRPFIAVTMLAVVAIALALWGWLKTAPPAVISRQRIVLWDTPQIAPGRVGIGLAISPDGATIAFMDSSEVGWQLYAKERDRLDATVVAGTLGVAGGLAFSSDGAWIAFVSQDGKLKKVPRGGGSAITIADSANVPHRAVAWLDGGTILYEDMGRGLHAVAQDGGTPRQVVQGPSNTDPASRVIWNVAGLPGGHAALLTTSSRTYSTWDLRVVDLRTLKVTVLEEQALQGWALPGGDVAFLRSDGTMFAAPFSMSRLAFTKAPTPVMEGVRVPDMAVSANGTAVYVAGAVAANVTRYQPVWVTRAGAATPIDPGWTVPFVGGSCNCLTGGLALSPDGRHLALTVWRDATNRDIDIKELDQAPFALTQLTFTGDNVSPAWTADGRSIIYATGTTANQTALRRRRADGTGPVDTLLDHAVMPALGTRGILQVVPTRDTTQFILQVGNCYACGDLALARQGDTTTVPLATNFSIAFINPALSPDGRWLAYASTETPGRFEVYVRPFPDVNAGRVQVSQGGGTEPRWAHSGKELFFRNATGALVAVAVVPAATFTPGMHTVLFEGSRFFTAGDRGYNALTYSVAPGDQRFVFMRPVVPTAAAGPAPVDKLVQVTNWAAEVQAKLAGRAPQ